MRRRTLRAAYFSTRPSGRAGLMRSGALGMKARTGGDASGGSAAGVVGSAAATSGAASCDTANVAQQLASWTAPLTTASACCGSVDASQRGWSTIPATARKASPTTQARSARSQAKKGLSGRVSRGRMLTHGIENPSRLIATQTMSRSAKFPCGEELFLCARVAVNLPCPSAPE